MIKHLKYLISFLLIFGLTVNQCSISSQINSTEYHHVSFLATRNGFSHRKSKLFTYTGQTFLGKVLKKVVAIFIHIKDTNWAEIRIILKLRSELYRNIRSKKTQDIFLSKTITSSNYYSSLHLA